MGKRCVNWVSYMDLGGTASWAGLLGSSPKGGHPKRVFPPR